jgi:type VI protein secretion system component Hcp
MFYFPAGAGAMPIGPSIENLPQTPSIVHAVLRSDDGRTYVADGDVVAPVAAVPKSAAPSGPVVMQIPSVTGSSTITGYSGAFNLLDFSFGVATSISSDAGAQKPVATNLPVDKPVDAATAALEGAGFTGKTFTGNSVITLLQQNGAAAYFPFATLTLSNVSVLGDVLEGSSGAQSVLESVTFGYVTMKFCYNAQSTNGAIGKSTCASYNYSTDTASTVRSPRASR